MVKEILKGLQVREKLNDRLIVALEHLPYKRRISIITSFIPVTDLEEIVKFQERG